MIVYRYENARGDGPYYTGGVWEMWKFHNDTANDPDAQAPAPRLDFPEAPLVSFRTKTHRFACPSIPALNAWFRGWEIDLERAGFRPVAYEVPDVAVSVSLSGKQCMFLLHQARRLEC